MLLYLASNPNLHLFDIIQDERIHVKKLTGEFNFKKFVIHDMRSFSHIRFIAIDHQALNDTEEEIVEGILGFRAMYDARIIYLAEGMKPGEKLLENLYEAGVRNFITATDSVEIKQEIMECISPNGMRLERIERFKRPPNEEIAKKTKRKKVKAEPDVPIIKKEISRIKEVKVVSKGIKSNLRIEERKGLTIGVAGVARETGTTTVALNLACYLSELGARVSYIECDPVKNLSWLARYNVNNNVQPIRHRGICFHTIKEKVNLLDYDFNILDLGCFSQVPQNINAFKASKVKILTASSRTFELESLPQDLEGIKDGLNLVISLTSDEEYEAIRNLVKDFSYQIYFAMYSPELFDPTHNRTIWKNIMGDYLDELGNRITEDLVAEKNAEASTKATNLFNFPISTIKKMPLNPKDVLSKLTIKTELMWGESKASKLSKNADEVGPMKVLMGQVIWVWTNDGSRRDTAYTVSKLAKIIAESLPVLIIDGSFDNPLLKRYFPCSKPGWEMSWIKKMPGIPPKHVYTQGNLTAWILTEALEVDQSLIMDMWDIALYYHRSRQRLIIIDGGEYSPPEGADIHLCLGNPSEDLNGKTIFITEDVDGDMEEVLNLLIQKTVCFEEEFSC